METVKLMQRSIIFIESFSKQFSPHTNLLLEVLRGQPKKLIHPIFYSIHTFSLRFLGLEYFNIIREMSQSKMY